MKHLAAIMDGNRRWAKKNSLKPWIGHKKGTDSVKTAVKFCLDHDIEYLSLYTFSLENFKRSKEELQFLFDLISDHVKESLDSFIENNICVRFIGDRSMFPESVAPIFEDVEEKTKSFSKLKLNFLFCYGSRQEIVGGIKKLVKKVQDGELITDQIDEKVLEDCLWTAGIPEPELIVRTGGAHRLSNFLLYQAAYSEFYFLDCYWPEITDQDLQKAVDSFEASQRNFGA